MSFSTYGRSGPSLTGVAVVVAVVSAACSPVEGGPPDLAAVESHLHLEIGYVPEGCDPVGLGGDGRGRMVASSFDCPEGVTIRVERFDSEFNDDVLAISPSETVPGRLEWRDGSTDDVIRVVSGDLDAEMLMRVALSIEIRD